MAISDDPAAATGERRKQPDRRSRTLHALFTGGWHARRRNPRRGEPVRPGSVDWHAPQWFAAALLVLLLSLADALLTLVLVHHGAIEVNPVMAPLVLGGGRGFAFLKLALTATAVTVLVALTRVPAFGRLLAGPILVGAAFIYVLLIGYELWLVDRFVS
ncbi:MAG TPA: DUF5658 family protein [Burkholderiaceae bacterium]|nr:DUF5658 family protein [Burkholderiaceae bacterium]